MSVIKVPCVWSIVVSDCSSITSSSPVDDTEELSRPLTPLEIVVVPLPKKKSRSRLCIGGPFRYRSAVKVDCSCYGPILRPRTSPHHRCTLTLKNSRIPSTTKITLSTIRVMSKTLSGLHVIFRVWTHYKKSQTLSEFGLTTKKASHTLHPSHTLGCSGDYGGHLKIETMLRDERFENVMGECVPS